MPANASKWLRQRERPRSPSGLLIFSASKTALPLFEKELPQDRLGHRFLHVRNFVFPVEQTIRANGFTTWTSLAAGPSSISAFIVLIRFVTFFRTTSRSE